MAINSTPDIHSLVICANVFIRKDNKYLVLRRSPHKKVAPDVIHPIGGKADINENPYQAALREVWEEVGVKVKNMKLEAIILEILPTQFKENWLIYHFSADYESGEVKDTEEGELVFLSKEQLLSEKLFVSVKKVIHHILNPEDGLVFATFEYDETNKEIIKEEISICNK